MYEINWYELLAQTLFHLNSLEIYGYFEKSLILFAKWGFSYKVKLLILTDGFHHSIYVLYII